MKKAFTFLIILLFNFSLKLAAQPYEKFIVEGAHWKIGDAGCPLGCDGGYYPHFNNTFWFKLEGDTVLNSKVYKKLFRSIEGTFQYTSSYSTFSGETWQLTAVLREDTLLREVFAIGGIGGCTSFQNDSLLFDFSKNQFDSLSNPISSAHAPIGCIDSSFIIDSIKQTIFYSGTRKTWFLSTNKISSLADYQLYEGIGPSYGLFGSPGPSFEGDYSSLLESYCVGPDSICGKGYIPVGIVEPTLSTKIPLYPNPATDYLMIDYNGQEDEVDLEINNELGQIVYQQKLPRYSGFQKVDVSRFVNGMYMVFIRRGNSIVGASRFAKE